MKSCSCLLTIHTLSHRHYLPNCSNGLTCECVAKDFHLLCRKCSQVEWSASRSHESGHVLIYEGIHTHNYHQEVAWNKRQSKVHDSLASQPNVLPQQLSPLVIITHKRVILRMITAAEEHWAGLQDQVHECQSTVRLMCHWNLCRTE